MKVLVTTLGRGHFIQVADALRRAGVDADLLQGWIVQNPEKNILLRIVARIIGRQSLIWGFARRTTPLLRGHNYGDFWAECLSWGVILFFTRVWKNSYMRHWGVKVGFWLHGLKMAMMLRKGDYRIAHVKSGLGRFAIDAAHKKGMKVLVDHSAGAPKFITETVDKKKWGSWTYWWTVQQDCDEADLLLVDCDWVKETFLMYGYPAEKIRVVYMGLDTKFNGLRDWSHEDVRQIGSAPSKPLRIVFSGPFMAHKGNEAFLDAIEALTKTDLNFAVDVIGVVDIQESVRVRCPVALSKINFHGHVPQTEMCDLMCHAHIYLFPSLSEGCAKSAFEAMSMGLCVVCTKETGLPLRDGVNGHLIVKNDPNSIVEKILELSAHPEHIKEAGISATATMKAYTWEAYAKNVEKLYGELVNV